MEARSIKTEVDKIAVFQQNGEIVIIRSSNKGRLPLPILEDIPEIKYERYGSSYRQTCPWGYAEFNPRTGLNVFVPTEKGVYPPNFEGYALTTPLTAVSAKVYDGYAVIEHDGESLPIEVDTDNDLYSALNRINRRLCELKLPFVVWQVEEAGKSGVIRIYNEHALAYAASAVWDSERNLLVAAVMGSGEKESLRAIRGSLVTNSAKSGVQISAPGQPGVWLSSARRGYMTIGSDLRQIGAIGESQALLHPSARSPQGSDGDDFYIVAVEGEEFLALLVERLNLAQAFPLKSEWGEYLYQAGSECGLIQNLQIAGSDYASAVQVKKSSDAWREVIRQGLVDRTISL